LLNVYAVPKGCSGIPVISEDATTKKRIREKKGRKEIFMGILVSPDRFSGIKLPKQKS
jgi:hypothetical protein